MLFSVLMAAAAANSAVVAASPGRPAAPPPLPPIEVVESIPVAPPPPLLVASQARFLAEGVVIFPVIVEVTGAGETLWSGRLVLSNRGFGATYSANQTDANPTCAEATTFATSQRSLRVSLSGSAQDGQRLRLSVNWVRPAGGCGSDMSTVGIERTFDLARGKAIEVRGDGGLSVRLTRPR